MNQAVRGAGRPFAGSALANSPRPPVSVPFIWLKRLRAVKVHAAPPEGPAATTPEPPAAASPATKSTGELAKEALLQIISSEATTAKDVLGESTLAQLTRALGEERAGQFIGALDGLLANRRLATLIFALVDVLLIWVAIKVFRSAVLHE